MTRPALLALASALAILAGGCSYTLTERSLLPQRDRPLPPAPGGVTQEPVELAVDGATLRGWLYRAPAAKRTIVYFYGSGGSVLGSAGSLIYLASTLSADIVSVDYRGHGLSDGQATFAAVGADALTTVDWARQRFPGRPLFVFGYSLGTAVATHTATVRSVDGVVLVAPPTSIDDMAVALRARGPWYWVFANIRVDPAIEALPQPQDEIAKVSAPLLIVHGTEDRQVPFSMGEKLLARAGTTTKDLCPVAGADHGSVFLADGTLGCLARFFSAR
jgi:uncharacterized protein